MNTLNEEVYVDGSLYKIVYRDDALRVNSKFVGDLEYEVTYNAVKQPLADYYSKYAWFCHNSVRTYPDGTKKVKLYENSKQFSNLIGNGDIGQDLSDYDLCPEILLWYGKGWVLNSDEYDLFFCVNDNQTLANISNYYGLPNPLPPSEDISTWSHPFSYHLHCEPEYKTDIEEFEKNGTYGALKIINGEPSLLKLYKKVNEFVAPTKKEINVFD